MAPPLLYLRPLFAPPPPGLVEASACVGLTGCASCKRKLASKQASVHCVPPSGGGMRAPAPRRRRCRRRRGAAPPFPPAPTAGLHSTSCWVGPPLAGGRPAGLLLAAAGVWFLPGGCSLPPQVIYARRFRGRPGADRGGSALSAACAGVHTAADEQPGPTWHPRPGTSTALAPLLPRRPPPCFLAAWSTTTPPFTPSKRCPNSWRSCCCCGQSSCRAPHWAGGLRGGGRPHTTRAAAAAAAPSRTRRRRRRAAPSRLPRAASGDWRACMHSPLLCDMLVSNADRWRKARRKASVTHLPGDAGACAPVQAHLTESPQWRRICPLRCRGTSRVLRTSLGRRNSPLATWEALGRDAGGRSRAGIRKCRPARGMLVLRRAARPVSVRRWQQGFVLRTCACGAPALKSRLLCTLGQDARY